MRVIQQIGTGKDIRQLVKSNKKPSMILGGCAINDTDYEVSAVSGSDGDIVFRALNAAFVGLMELNTVGTIISEEDKSKINRSSLDFLKYAMEEFYRKEPQYRVFFVDICIVCDKVKLNRYLPQIRLNLLSIFHTEKLGIKCTDTGNCESLTIECDASIQVGYNYIHH